MANEILTLPGKPALFSYDEEYDDVEDLLSDAVEDADEVGEEYREAMPKDYILGILGHRGGGKSALLAHYLFNCLAAGCTVFTNLEMWPEKLGITNYHLFPLDQEHLLRFDPALHEAVLGIEEVGMWFERKRGMATTSIIQEKFLQLVVRKQNLRIFFTNQSPLLPGALAEQTDLAYQAFDVFFCDWARDANIAKGTTFMYEATDRTGIGGMQWRTWRITLRKANRLWNTYNTFQMFDPFQWARKTEIRGGGQIIDLDAEEATAYASSEEGIRAWQKDIQAYNVLLSKVIGSYQGTGFMELADQHQALAELPDRYVFEVDKLRRCLHGLKGQKRKDAEEAYNELRALASQGQIARFGDGHDIIELAKPVTDYQGGDT